MADRRSLFIKVSIEDLEKSKEALKSLGADGEKAFKRIEKASNDAAAKAAKGSDAFLGLKTGIKEIDRELEGAEKRLGRFFGAFAGAALGTAALWALAEAWEAVTEKTRKAEEQNKKTMEAAEAAAKKLSAIQVTAEQDRANAFQDLENRRAFLLEQIRITEQAAKEQGKLNELFGDDFLGMVKVDPGNLPVTRRLKELRDEMAKIVGTIAAFKNTTNFTLYDDPLLRIATGKMGVRELPDTPKSGGVDEHKQILQEIEKLEQEAERKRTLNKAEEAEVRYRQEIEKWQKLNDEKKISDEELWRASSAAAQRAQGEIDKIAEEGAQKQAEALTKAHEEAAKESQRIWKRFYEDIADAVFDSLVPSGSQSPIARAFFRLAGSSLAQEFNPILSGLGLAAPLPGAQNSSLFNLGASLSGLTVFGRGLFTGPSGRLDPATGTPLPGGPGLLQQGLTGGATGFGIGSILSNLFPGALNAGNSQIGGSLGGLAGGVAGGLGALGSTLGPFGGIIGGLLGSILGGLFGPKKPSVGPNSTAAILVGEGGALRVVGTGADNGGSVDSALALARGFATALDRLTETLGVRIAPHLNMAGQESGLGRVMGFQAGTFGGQFNLGFWGNEVSGTDAEDVVKRMLFRVLKDPRTGGFEGFSADVAKAIANSTAADLEGLLSDIEFAKGLRDLVDGLEASGDALKAVEVAARDAARTQVKAITDFFDRASALGFQAEALSGRDSLVQQLLDFSAKPEAVSETAKALAALGATLKVVRENAEALGVTEAEVAAAETAAKEELRKGFDEGIAQQILAIVDPVAAALAEFDKAAAQRLEEARLAGANLVEVERLNALQRQQVLEQAGAASRSSLLKFWEDITFGGLSGASPMASLEGTRASFLAAAAQGDRGRIEDLGRSLLERSRGAFASSAGFQSDLDLVRSIVEPLVLANDNAVVNAIYTSGGELARLMAKSVEQQAAMRSEIEELRRDNADLKTTLQRLLVAAA